MVRETGRSLLGNDTWSNGGVVVPADGLPVLPKWSPAEAQELWVHNLATSLPERSAGRAAQSGAELHEAPVELLGHLVAVLGGRRLPIEEEVRVAQPKHLHAHARGTSEHKRYSPEVCKRLCVLITAHETLPRALPGWHTLSSPRAT